MNAATSRKQPALLGFLTLVFCFVLYMSFTSGEAEETESGFDGLSSTDAAIEEPTLSLVQEWQPPSIQRNPFEGPYTAGLDQQIGGVELENDDADGAPDSDDGPEDVIVTDEDFGDAPPLLGFDPDEESQLDEFASE